MKSHAPNANLSPKNVGPNHHIAMNAPREEIKADVHRAVVLEVVAVASAARVARSMMNRVVRPHGKLR